MCVERGADERASADEEAQDELGEGEGGGSDGGLERGGVKHSGGSQFGVWVAQKVESGRTTSGLSRTKASPVGQSV